MIREPTEFCEFTLIRQGQEFPAHRLILSVTSSYLRASQFPGVKRTKNPEKITYPANTGGDGVGGGDGGGGLSTEKSRNVYTSKFCPKTFPSKMRKAKHLKKKTFNLSEISGDITNLTKKDDCGWNCFRGFRHKFKSRVISHAQKHLWKKTFKHSDSALYRDGQEMKDSPVSPSQKEE